MDQVDTWFETWFDTEYYHQLYRDRDENEAAIFIDNLVRHLNAGPDAKMLDIGCGRGRHAHQLAKKGFEVTGIDLSPKNIAFAKQFESDTLDFEVHDMRKPFKRNQYDYALNLFTSFGYFRKKSDNIKALAAMYRNLKLKGTLVVDFMNIEKVLDNLVPKETKVVDDIEFRITRSIEDNFVVKRIQFEDGGKSHEYEERVQALKLTDFRYFFQMNSFRLVNIFGDHEFSDFDQYNSDRLILVARKQP